MSIGTYPTRQSPQSLDELIGQLLEEQSSMTAVEKFSQQHAGATEHVQRRYYHDLLPATGPSEGEQFAFEVDLDTCSGCKACVIACHSLNGLDGDEIWREVGLLQGEGEFGEPVQHHVTTACHHCVEPGCLSGCPVAAYEKDPATGIVFHLDDQCIGCKYCTLTCPYEVPKYNESMGIVRKCDMCRQRLGRDEAPACVQSCPNQAIRITVVSTQETLQRASDESFLPAAPHPSMTKPTTRYTAIKPLPASLTAGDRGHVELQEAHWPLVWMLLLTQLATGLLIAEIVASGIGAMFGSVIDPAVRLSTLWIGFGTAFIGMHVGVLHLGRPLYGFRALLGLRTSWLSREILAFGLLMPVAATYCVAATWSLLPAWVEPLAAAACLGIGLVAVATSAMVYGATKRPTWRPSWVIGYFFTAAGLLGTTATGGVAASMPLWQQTAEPNGLLTGIAIASICMAIARFGCRSLTLRTVRIGDPSLYQRAAALHNGPLRIPVTAAAALLIVGGILLPAVLLAIQVSGSTSPYPIIALATLSALLCFASVAIDRYVFFLSAAAAKMPGYYAG